MKIRRVISSIGLSGLVYKDLAAIKAGAQPNGALLYHGKPVTPGFTRIIEPGRSLSVMLELEDGSIAFGDCADVILVGIAGREGMFDPVAAKALVDGPVAERLIGRDVTDFRALAAEMDALVIDGRRPHGAVRYGLSQAVLHAAATANRRTMTEVIAAEYGLSPRTARLPVLAGALRLDWAQHDRLILKRADVLPHTPFLSVRDHVGFRGELLIEYMERLVARIAEVGEEDYRPRLHIDLYGTLGELFANDAEKIADYIAGLGRIAAPLNLMVESPVIAASQAEQIAIYTAMRARLDAMGSDVALVMDEWANTIDDLRALHAAGALQNVQIKTPDMGGITNTIDALMFCHQAGIGACLGGSANETDQSARITANIGLACGALMMSTKPGQGADEGWMILVNEMERVLALIRARG